MTAEVHHIGEVAVAVGLSLKTIRHYDEVGVVPPSGRSAGGFRLYTDEDIERLRLVKLMKPLDFTLDEMRQLLQARDELGSEDLTVERREDLRGRLAMFAALVEQRSLRLREQLDAVEGLSSLLHQEAAAVEE